MSEAPPVPRRGTLKLPKHLVHARFAPTPTVDEMNVSVRVRVSRRDVVTEMASIAFMHAGAALMCPEGGGADFRLTTTRVRRRQRRRVKRACRNRPGCVIWTSCAACARRGPRAPTTATGRSRSSRSRTGGTGRVHAGLRPWPPRPLIPAVLLPPGTGFAAAVTERPAGALDVLCNQRGDPDDVDEAALKHRSGSARARDRSRSEPWGALRTSFDAGFAVRRTGGRCAT